MIYLQNGGQSGNSLAINFGYTTSYQKLPEALGWIVDTPNADFPIIIPGMRMLRFMI